MYRDLGGGYGRQPSGTPRKTPQLTTGQQRLLMWVLGLEMFLLFIAPIGGSSLVTVAIYIVHAIVGARW